MLMRINTYSVPFSLCCLLEDARCERDLCQVSCGIPGSGWPCWMLMLCHSRTPYAVALALKRSPCTPQMGLRLQLPTSCSCGNPRCAETSWLVFGLLNRWKMGLFGKGCNVSWIHFNEGFYYKEYDTYVKDFTYSLCWFPVVWAGSQPC